MTIYGRMLVAGLGSAALLLAALGFQYLGGLAPCPLCIWQRWPHVAAVALAALGTTVLWRAHDPVMWAGGLSMAVGAGLAAWHGGIERGWWEGPASCAGPGSLDMPADQLLDRIMASPLVRCDEIVWSFLGLSMTNWNMLACLGLMAVWLWPYRDAARG